VISVCLFKGFEPVRKMKGVLRQEILAVARLNFKRGSWVKLPGIAPQRSGVESVMRQSRMAGTARRAVRVWFFPELSPRRGSPTLPRAAVTEALLESLLLRLQPGKDVRSCPSSLIGA